MVVFPGAFSLTPGIVNGLTVLCADLPVGLCPLSLLSRLLNQVVGVGLAGWAYDHTDLTPTMGYPSGCSRKQTSCP